MTDRRLIEEAFPLKQASIYSVHEKNVRHGHLSTLHVWPARRPLAACRAALICALLPDPGDPQSRDELIKRIGGQISEGAKPEIGSGVLAWGHEQNDDIKFFRDQIRQAFAGRAPKVLDMFAGGGAIPLEAVRLGCQTTAMDYNPVAWFLLKCTLEFPNKLANCLWPLPIVGKSLLFEPESVSLVAHVRYWGERLSFLARVELEEYFPSLPLDPEGTITPQNPVCETVAYLWARTVPHPDPQKNGLQVPMLKTMWLCRKPNKKRALRYYYSKDANRFEFEVFTPSDDSEVAEGTMSGRGVQCPATSGEETGVFLPLDYIQRCGCEGRLQVRCTSVVVDVPRLAGGALGRPTGKEYRSPTVAEIALAESAITALPRAASNVPDGLPDVMIPPNPRRVGTQLYGIDTWSKLFTPRQLLVLSTFVKLTRTLEKEMREAYSGGTDDGETLVEAITGYLALAVDRLADYSSSLTHWHVSKEQMSSTFSRFALPMNWDFSEVNPISSLTGSYSGGIEWIAKVIDHLCKAATHEVVQVKNGSAAEPFGQDLYDTIVTDPPYYDSIPYSDISDFFYVWLRRVVGDRYKQQFDSELVPRSCELVADRLHPALTSPRSVQGYELGMAAAFKMACRALKQDGRMVIVFAHKQPNAWETLVSAMVEAGFIVTASWPIATEMSTRPNALGTAALASSIWLVCRKRASNSGKGWYKQVQARMRERITERLRYFWDQGIRGPDFLWSAVGPGLESFSAYDEVRRNDGSPVTVSEFLKEVRRITTDFALGQIIEGSTEGLDEWTRYALMHHQNFAMAGAPVGECILLSGAYGLNLGDLTGPRGILTKGKSKPATSAEGEEVEAESTGGGGSELRLLRWDERLREDLGEPHISFGIRYIDMLHRLLREWASGDVSRVAAYAEQQGLGQNDLFWRVAQAFAEMSPLQSKERGLLEAVISWGRGRLSSPVAPAAEVKPSLQTTFKF